MTFVRLPFNEDVTTDLVFDVGELPEANSLLARAHYLGTANRAEIVFVGHVGSELVAAQVWVTPTARKIPADGTWLELSRWCLVPGAGPNAGSKQHAYAARKIRSRYPSVTTLLSYSDPSVGHDGTLYRACNWRYAPTHHALRRRVDGVGYPTRAGSWDGVVVQEAKDRWVYPLRRDRRRSEILSVETHPAIEDLAAEYGYREP